MTRRLRLSLGAWQKLSAKIDPSQSRLALRTSLAYWLCGLGHSLLLRLQDASHAEALKTLAPNAPIFILGFWRSGTTFLHELLCCDPRFGFPSTYACLNPSHFVLTENLSTRASSVESLRPMDNMRYSWTSPQEDEFALLAFGAPSPYESLLIPSLMRDPDALVDWKRRTPEEQECWVKSLRSFLSLLTVQQRKTMIFKSPPHGFKLPLLSSIFPDARFVIIERNPYEVFASNLKLWRTLLNLYAVEVWSEEVLEQFVLRAYVLHESAVVEGAALLSVGRIARVRYEDLVENPIAQTERLYEALNLGGFNEVRGLIEQYSRKVVDHRRNQFELSKKQRRAIEEVWGSLIAQKGYEWPGNYLTISDEAIAIKHRAS